MINLFHYKLTNLFLFIDNFWPKANLSLNMRNRNLMIDIFEYPHIITIFAENSGKWENSDSGNLLSNMMCVA